MDRIIIIDDDGIQEDLNRFLETNKTKIRLDSDFFELSSGKSSAIKEIIETYEDKYKVKIHSKDNVHLFKINEIIFLQSQPEGTKLHLANNKTLFCESTMETIGEQIKDHPFIAVHSDYIVNIHHIVRISDTDKTRIDLSNGESVPISEHKKQLIIQELEKYYT